MGDTLKAVHQKHAEGQMREGRCQRRRVLQLPADLPSAQHMRHDLLQQIDVVGTERALLRAAMDIEKPIGAVGSQKIGGESVMHVARPHPLLPEFAATERRHVSSYPRPIIDFAHRQRCRDRADGVTHVCRCRLGRTQPRVIDSPDRAERLLIEPRDTASRCLEQVAQPHDHIRPALLIIGGLVDLTNNGGN
ncbi:hypothetical protein [Mesorhizobium sp.]|uniref:hypothetical protein n=1 Tax=Mesorhizobium sp. TaxID=1871066 RepID=UPI0025EE947F|nr:hypothetical protein [Mesorhizobium sp.]